MNFTPLISFLLLGYGKIYSEEKKKEKEGEIQSKSIFRYI